MAAALADRSLSADNNYFVAHSLRTMRSALGLVYRKMFAIWTIHRGVLRAGYGQIDGASQTPHELCCGSVCGFARCIRGNRFTNTQIIVLLTADLHNVNALIIHRQRIENVE